MIYKKVCSRELLAGSKFVRRVIVSSISARYQLCVYFVRLSLRKRGAADAREENEKRGEGSRVRASRYTERTPWMLPHERCIRRLTGGAIKSRQQTERPTVKFSPGPRRRCRHPSRRRARSIPLGPPVILGAIHRLTPLSIRRFRAARSLAPPTAGGGPPPALSINYNLD